MNKFFFQAFKDSLMELKECTSLSSYKLLKEALKGSLKTVFMHL